MIDKERQEELYNNWLDETQDDEGEDWRQELTEEERELISQWDEKFPL